MRIAIVGVTGLVGQEMLRVLAEQNFPVTEIIPVASEKSVGQVIEFGNVKYTVVNLEKGLEMKPDIALFSAGGEISKLWAPKYAEAGIKVIDNSSAWRMDTDKKLIIPEVNGNQLEKSDMIIANPNCSTIQMLMVLSPIHKEYGIERVVVSTYQSISGTGAKAIAQMKAERVGDKSNDMAYPYPIDQNCLPHCDDFLENDYTKEEMKLVNETHKILDDSIKVTATAVRVPVSGGHSESINLTLNKELNIGDIRKLLHNTPGVILKDNPTTNTYPMPLFSQGKDDVYVGRIRKDYSQENGLNLWVVADNLRKGAATNTVQIAKYLIENSLL